MNQTLVLYFVTFFFVLTYSCRQTDRSTLDYDELKFDTNTISIFNWDTSKYVFPNNSDPLPLTQEDIFAIDSLITDAIDSFNATVGPELFQAFNQKVSLESFIIKRIEYKYQIFPYKDVNGQRVVFIIGFSGSFKPWKTETYRWRRHYGMSKIELKLNLSDKTRGNLETGDFG